MSSYKLYQMNKLIQLPRPVIFAHRGSSAYAPENTLAAFELAVRQGADAIELDAKLCADGHVVVIHDQTVDRTTEGTGYVNKLTLAALRELDAGLHFDVEFKGEKIPTLEEVFEAVGKQIYINVELSNYAAMTDALAAKVAELVRKHDLENNVLFSSFNPLALLSAHRHLPQVPIGLLALPGASGAWARSWPGNLIPRQALHPEKSDVTYRLVDKIHRNRQRLHVYTINDAETMRHLFNLGVDGIFTDDPLLAKEVLSSPKN